MSRKKRQESSDDDVTYFVTNDMRMFDGHLDPDDCEILRGKHLITGEDALRLAAEEQASKAAGSEVGKLSAKQATLEPGKICLTPETTTELGKNAIATLTHYEGLASALVTRLPIAPAVRSARIDDKCTWRAVARRLHESMQKEHRLATGLWEPASNQLMGMALCKVAAQTYDEDFMETPWN